jgi:hypothetical protein
MPEKFQERWTGPYQIFKQLTDVNYMIRVPEKKKKGGLMRVHLDVIRPYFPWDDDLLDTSPVLDIDGHPFALVGDPGDHQEPAVEPAVGGPIRAAPVFRGVAISKKGDIFILHLPGQPIPEQDWGVAKMIRQDAEGYLIFQWLGNAYGDWTRPVQLEWAKMEIDPVTAEPTTTVQHIKHARSKPFGYIPYTCDHTTTGTKLSDVLLTGVRLHNRQLPQETVQMLSDSRRVTWTLPGL